MHNSHAIIILISLWVMFRTQITLERKGINMVFYLTLQVFFFFLVLAIKFPKSVSNRQVFFRKHFKLVCVIYLVTIMIIAGPVLALVSVWYFGVDYYADNKLTSIVGRFRKARKPFLRTRCRFMLVCLVCVFHVAEKQVKEMRIFNLSENPPCL